MAEDTAAIEQACKDLIVAVTHFGDHRQVDEALTLFADDATWLRAGTQYRGLTEIRDSYAHGSPTQVTLHLIGGTKVTVRDADHADAVTYYLALTGDTGAPDPALPLPLEPFSAGEWHDGFVRTDAGWKFSSRATRRVFARNTTR